MVAGDHNCNWRMVIDNLKDIKNETDFKNVFNILKSKFIVPKKFDSFGSHI